MKKGISIWTFTERSPEVCFSLARKYGFDGVEVGLGREGPLRFDSTDDEIKERLEQIKRHFLEIYNSKKVGGFDGDN